MRAGASPLDAGGLFDEDNAALAAQYDGAAVVPLDLVCRDYFRHLSPEALVVKITKGEILLPLVRLARSQKCAKGIATADLAKYLDDRIAEAREEFRQIHGRPFSPPTPAAREPVSGQSRRRRAGSSPRRGGGRRVSSRRAS